MKKSSSLMMDHFNLLVKKVFILAGLILSVDLSSQSYNMTNATTVNTCSGTFYDSGGPSGNYQNSEVSTMTFCSCTGTPIRMVFTSFSVENLYDRLVIHDGATTAAPTIGTYYSGSVAPGTVTSTGTCLTFEFQSDNSVIYSGWAATISCMPAITTSATPSAICQGSTSQLNATAPSSTIPSIFTVGTGTLQNSNTSYPAPYGQWYTGVRHQMLIRATELNAAGLGAGNITSLAFEVVTPNGAYTNFTISIGTTALTALTTTFQGGMTQVFSAVTFTPVAGWNTHTFTTPFNWNGTSNLIVETCFLNCSSCPTVSCSSYTNNAVHKQTSTSYTSSLYYYADNNCNVCTQTTGFLASQRPNMRLGGLPVNVYSWAPSATLSNPAIQNPVASPTSSTTYTLTVTSNGCNRTATVSVTVNPSPTVTVTPASASICSGGSTNLLAAGANSYSWSPATGLSATTGASVTASPTVTTTYTITGTGTNGCTGTSSITVTVNPLPVVTITPSSASICPGASTNLAASGANTYSWSPATGLNTSTGPNVTASPSATTTYTVTGTSAAGCNNTSTSTVNVYSPPPVPIITASGPTTFCQGGSVQLTSSSSANNLWSENSTTQSITVNSSGNYSVTVTDANGCSSASAPTSVTVNPVPPTPVITATGPVTFCQGGSVQLTSSSATGNLWSENSTTQTITVNNSGNYSVTVTDANGCSAISAPTSITVNPAPPTPVITAGGPTTFCQGGSVQLTSSSATDNLWSENSTTQAISVNTSGNYSVTVTDANGCSSTSAATSVTVIPAPPTPVITANGPTTFCQGGNVMLTSGAANSYLWSENSTTQSITVNATGSYNVTITDANGCSATSSGTTVTVNALPVVSFSGLNGGYCTANDPSTLTGSPAGGTFTGPGIAGNNFDPVVAGIGTHSIAYSYTDANGCSNSANQSTVVSSNAFVNLGADAILCTIDQLTLSAGNFSSYVWQDNSTASTFVVDGPTLGAGVYTFYVEVTDANGCSGTDTITISVIVCSTGISEYGAMEVSVSPNPTDGLLNLTVANSTSNNLTFEIMNVEGQIVYLKNIIKTAADYSGQLDISSLAKGIYYLQISDGENISVLKVMVY